MTSVFWALVASTVVVGLEFGFRHDISWVRNLWWITPAALLVNFAIYKLLQGDIGWMYSMVLFGASTAVGRIGLSFGVLHDPVTVSSVVSAAVLVVGVGVRLVFR
mgnify:CR=1 FL=1